MHYIAKNGFRFNLIEGEIEAYGSRAKTTIWLLLTGRTLYTLTPIMRRVEPMAEMKGVPAAWGVTDPLTQGWWIASSLDDAADRIAAADNNNTSPSQG